MDFNYKLVMFGFPALCEDIEEVKLRMKQIPLERAKAETLEQCYLIELKTAKHYKILCDKKGYFIDKDEMKAIKG